MYPSKRSSLTAPCLLRSFHNSSPISLDRVEQLALEALPADASDGDKAACRVDLYKGDITSKDDLEKLFIDYLPFGGIWGTIHLAAHKAVGESGQKPLQYYENNITGTINLLALMDKHNTKRFVFSSSATVYGCPKVIPIPEWSPMQAESCYGRTKVMTEQILKDLCDSQPNEWRAIALRYFNPAGAHPSGRIGEDPVGKPGNLLPLMAQVATGRLPQSSFKVFGSDYPTPDGTCLRDYIHGKHLPSLPGGRSQRHPPQTLTSPLAPPAVMDLAQGHVDALRALPRDEIFAPDPNAESTGFGGSGGKYKMYNLGKGKGLSVLDMVAAMEKATGFKFEAEIVGRR